MVSTDKEDEFYNLKHVAENDDGEREDIVLLYLVEVFYFAMHLFVVINYHQD